MDDVVAIAAILVGVLERPPPRSERQPAVVTDEVPEVGHGASIPRAPGSPSRHLRAGHLARTFPPEPRSNEREVARWSRRALSPGGGRGGRTRPTAHLRRQGGRPRRVRTDRPALPGPRPPARA